VTASPLAGLRLGPVHLTVTDLDRAVAFYQDVIGLRLGRRDEGEVAMGDGEHELLVLVEDQAARTPGREAGLYHYCLLYPSREELARAAVRIAVSRTPIQGASDHHTHEAIYLADPDGNGIELAADRPRAVWPDVRSLAGYAGGPAPLDTQGLLRVVEGEEPARHVGPGLEVGHLHLHVGDVDRGLAFYRDVVGFDLMVNLGPAAFVSVDGYHHHLGFNVWRGDGVPAVPEGTVGLRAWTIVLPDAGGVHAARERLEAAGAPIEERPDGFLTSDPWGIPMAVTT
jgi:catechol 2,3-dioxygenase